MVTEMPDRHDLHPLSYLDLTAVLAILLDTLRIVVRKVPTNRIIAYLGPTTVPACSTETRDLCEGNMKSEQDTKRGDTMNVSSDRNEKYDPKETLATKGTTTESRENTQDRKGPRDLSGLSGLSGLNDLSESTGGRYWNLQIARNVLSAHEEKMLSLRAGVRVRHLAELQPQRRLLRASILNVRR